MVRWSHCLSLAATVWLMLNLQTSTWTMFGVWMVVGLAIYGLYGRGTAGWRRGQLGLRPG